MNTRLRVEGATLKKSGSAQRLPDLLLTAQRSLLVDHWGDLLDYLCGSAKLTTGRIQLDEKDARWEASRGRLGFAGGGATLNSEQSVRSWIASDQRLLGRSSAQGCAAADWALAQLGLTVLAEQALRELLDVERLAAQCARALACRPVMIVVRPPQLTADTVELELRLLERLASSCSVTVLCDSRRLPLLRTWAQNGSIHGEEPWESRASSELVLRARGPVPKLVDQWQARGASIQELRPIQGHEDGQSTVEVRLKCDESFDNRAVLLGLKETGSTLLSLLPAELVAKRAKVRA